MYGDRSLPSLIAAVAGPLLTYLTDSSLDPFTSAPPAYLMPCHRPSASTMGKHAKTPTSRPRKRKREGLSVSTEHKHANDPLAIDSEPSLPAPLISSPVDTKAAVNDVDDDDGYSSELSLPPPLTGDGSGDGDGDGDGMAMSISPSSELSELSELSSETERLIEVEDLLLLVPSPLASSSVVNSLPPPTARPNAQSAAVKKRAIAYGAGNRMHHSAKRQRSGLNAVQTSEIL